MITAKAHLVSASPYGQSRYHGTDKLDKESGRDYEKRTWRERCHYDPKTKGLYIPPMAFKNCLSEAAKYLSIQIPGKGKATYTKHFEAGVLVTEPLPLPIKLDDVEGEWLFLNADGKRGSSTRVERCMPVVREWEGVVPFLVFDETVTEDVFRKHLEEAGKFIGIGRFRPRNNGYYGRFAVKKIEWIKS